MNIYETNCNLKLVTNLIGGKWKILILHFLNTHGTLRYSKLKHFVQGITGTMLSQSLKELEQHQLIIRTQYNEPYETTLYFCPYYC